MEPYKACPKCENLTSYSYYFGAYRCKCGWRDETARIEREKRHGLRIKIVEVAPTYDDNGQGWRTYKAEALGYSPLEK